MTITQTSRSLIRAERTRFTASRSPQTRTLPALAAAFAILSASLALAAPPAATFTGIGRFGEANTIFGPAITGASADGSVLCGTVDAYRESGPHAFHPFRWSGGTLTQLPERAGVSQNSQAQAISADGSVIAGVSGGRVVRWVNGAAPQLLGSLPGGDGGGGIVALSPDGGVILGSAGEPFLWTAAGGIVGLGVLPGAFWNGYMGASDDGAIACGNSTFPSPNYRQQAWRWSRAGGLAELPALAGDNGTTVAAVNRDGSAVGQSLAQGRSIPVRWDATGLVSALPLPLGMVSASALLATPDGSVIFGTGVLNRTLVGLRWTAAGVEILGPGMPTKAISADGAVIYGDGKMWDAVNGVRDLKTVLLENYGVDAVRRWRLVEERSSGTNVNGPEFARTTGSALILASTARNPNIGDATRSKNGIEGWLATLPLPNTAQANPFGGDMLKKSGTFNPKATFKEHYDDFELTVTIPAEDGFPADSYKQPAARWSASASVTASIAGLDLGQITAATPVRIRLGDFYLSKTLGDAADWAPGRKRATFPLRYGKLTVSWNAKTVTYTASNAITGRAKEGSDAFDSTVADWIAFPHYVGISFRPTDYFLRLAVGFADRTGTRDLVFTGVGSKQNTYGRWVELHGATDSTPPAIKFAVPAANSVYFSSQISVRLEGKASAFAVRVNGGDYQSVSLSPAYRDHWSFNLSLVPGVNLIEAKASDTTGNESALIKRTVTYSTTEGGYFGLIHVGGNNGEAAGYFSLSATKTNTFTGKLILPAGTFSFKGAFTADGSATVQVARGKLPALALNLQTTISADGKNTIGGGFVEESVNYTLDVGRALPSYAGYWTAALPPDASTLADASLPRGSGYFTVNTAASNAARVVGKLPDGTSFSFAGTMDASGYVAVYAPLTYGKAKGLLAGVAALAAPGDSQGHFFWTKPEQPGAARFPAAFALHSTVRASNYYYGTFFQDSIREKGGTARVTAGATVLVEKAITVNRSSLIVTPAAADKLTVKAGKGLITGSVILPGQTKPVNILGIAVGDAAYGFCLEDTASDGFSITANP